MKTIEIVQSAKEVILFIKENNAIDVLNLTTIYLWRITHAPPPLRLSVIVQVEPVLAEVLVRG